MKNLETETFDACENGKLQSLTYYIQGSPPAAFDPKLIQNLFDCFSCLNDRFSWGLRRARQTSQECSIPFKTPHNPSLLGAFIYSLFSPFSHHFDWSAAKLKRSATPAARKVGMETILVSTTQLRQQMGFARASSKHICSTAVQHSVSSATFSTRAEGPRCPCAYTCPASTDARENK